MVIYKRKVARNGDVRTKYAYVPIYLFGSREWIWLEDYLLEYHGGSPYQGGNSMTKYDGALSYGWIPMRRASPY